MRGLLTGHAALLVVMVAIGLILTTAVVADGWIGGRVTIDFKG